MEQCVVLVAAGLGNFFMSFGWARMAELLRWGRSGVLPLWDGELLLLLRC